MTQRSAGRRLRVALVSVQPADQVSRLRRIAGALRRAGHETWLIAGTTTETPAKHETGPGGDILERISVSRSERWLYRFKRVVRGVSARIPGSLWRLFEFSEPASVWLRQRLDRELAEGGRLYGALDIVIGHDLSAMPLARWLRERTGGRLVFDATELSSEQYGYSRAWRLVERPFILQQEAYHARGSDALLSPSPNYLEHLSSLHGLTKPQCVVRNVMEQIERPARRSLKNESLVAIYQGLALPNRGIETYIDSVQEWPENTRLVLQLAGTPRYLAALQERGSARNQGGRIKFIPPAGANARELVASIVESGASIGLCCFDPSQAQVKLSEPNKLHTYIAAGITVIGVAGTRVGTLVNAENIGIAIPEFTPESVAGAMRTFANQPREVERMCNRACQLAGKWTWESEQYVVLKFLEKLASDPDCNQ